MAQLLSRLAAPWQTVCTLKEKIMKATLVLEKVFAKHVIVIAFGLFALFVPACQEKPVTTTPEPQEPIVPEVKRSEERRVGKECEL